jgi:hypothetical protein
VPSLSCSLRRPSARHVLFQHPARRSPDRAGLSLPRHAVCHPPGLLSAAAHRRCSPTGATSCFWQPPRVAPRPAAARVLPAVFSRVFHASPPLPELRPRPPRTSSAASTCSRSPCLLLNLKHILELPVHSLLHSRTHIFTALLLPERAAPPELRRSSCSSSTAAAVASHPRSSALAAPPQPTEAHRPAQFRSLAPERLDHYAGELELPPPLGLAVVPPLRRLSAPDKHTTSPTSSRGSYLATSPPLSCPPATGTPLPFLRAPPPAPVRRRYAATAPLFPNTGHPRGRRELLNFFPHLPLAAGEPPRRNLIATDRYPCVARPRIQLQGFESFQGPFCRKSVPPL